MQVKNTRTGMSGLIVVLIGQAISLLGSGMTQFAVSIWAYEKTGRATDLALVAFFAFGPTVLFSPLAGALVDRWNRKLVLMLSDLAAGIMTIIQLLLLVSGNLQIWHLFVINFLAGSFGAFQFPAYSAAVTMIIPKEQYTRASGMMSLAGSASFVFAPILAGSLVGVIGFEGIMAIDVVTFVFAIGALLFVTIPQPKTTAEGLAGKGNLWTETLYGFRYIIERPSLLGLQLIFFAINFFAMLGITVTTPMILASTGNNERILGVVLSAGAIGGVLGGLLLSAWGGPRKKVHGVLLGMIGISLFGQFGMGLGSSLSVALGLSSGLLIWGTASFLANIFLPIINGSNQAIWQSKVAPDVQGRVFAVRRWIAQITAPVAMLLAGPLADRVLEPAMSATGSLADDLGWLVGVGPGSGMQLMFTITGLLGAFVGVAGYLFPIVRDAEILLPDHESEVQEQQAETELLFGGVQAEAD